MEKECPRCGLKKKLELEYHKNKRNKNGYSSRCKVCVRQHVNDRNKTEQGKKRTEEYNKSERGRIARERYAKSERNKERQHRYNRSEKSLKYKREWNKKAEKDVSRKIKSRMRSRIHNALKEKYILNKSASTTELTGCSWKELRNHLESQFTEGMTWENYGEWHVDHIEACAKFDLSKEEEQRKCFHYSNLQPLWAVDNLKKGSKNESY